MKRIHIIIQELDNVEMMIKDVLQYFSYFIRPDFSQKPDVEIATEKYKDIADRHTVEELKNIVGKNNLIDFDSLGSSRIEIETDKIEYDPIIDGDLSEYDDDDDNNKLYLDNDEDEQETESELK